MQREGKERTTKESMEMIPRLSQGMEEGFRLSTCSNLVKSVPGTCVEEKNCKPH